jgi:peptidyl-prolyl cis-trans isomerase SurA
MVTAKGAMTHAAIAAVLITAAVSPARLGAEEPKGEIIDRVVAVVEDRAVLQSEVDLEFRRMMLRANRTTIPLEEERRIREEIVNGLIAEHLMSVHAVKVGVEVKDEEIDSEVERLIEENKRALGGDEAFEAQLESEGITLTQLRSMYREKTRSNILVQRLMLREVRSEIQVTEGDVRKYYLERVDSLPMRPATVTLAHILLVPRVSELSRQAALEKVAAIEKKLQGGMDFAAAAKEYSEGPSAKYGGSLGYKKLGDFGSPEFTAAVRKLLVGGVSPPVLTRFGYHIIKLESVQGDEVLVRHILVKLESSREDFAATEAQAERIRREIIAGADFGEMAAEHSADDATKNNGGIVGEIAIANLPEFFLESIRNTKAGEVAPVIKEPNRYRIVKVLGRTPARRYTLEEARDELRRLLEEQKLQERFHDYVESLRKLYYVEMKEDLRG